MGDFSHKLKNETMTLTDHQGDDLPAKKFLKFKTVARPWHMVSLPEIAFYCLIV